MMLTLNAVTHSYGRKPILRDMSLTIAKGEVIALLGASGCGKTTLLRLIAGLLPLQQGSIMLADRLVAAPQRHVLPEDRRVGVVFQDYALFPHLTVQENIGFGLPRAARREVQSLLQCFGMQPLAEFYPHQLSGGQQQRVALLRAIAPKPEVLLMDEPFNSLDGQCRQAVRLETSQFLRRHGMTTIIVTHEPDEAMLLADRIVLLRDGGIEQVGTPQELYNKPASAYVMQFFGIVNSWHVKADDGHLQTVFGRIPFAHQTSSANILLRPDALRFSDAPEAVAAEVREARLAGSKLWLTLRLEGTDQPVTMAATDAMPLPADGRVYIEADKARLHVFPCGTDC